MNKKILVADDDQAILEAITMILKTEGYEVKTTQNGDEIKSLCKDSPDLLLLDIGMSGHDGKEICREIKSRKNTKHIPVIMVSANKDTEKIAKEAGADAFLSKPFDMKDLLSMVAEYTSKEHI